MSRARALVGLLLAIAGLLYAAHAIAGGSSYPLRVLSLSGVFAILVLGYQFIFGYAGALALSQGTFMGVAAYVSGVLDVQYGIAFDAALGFSIAAPVLLAWLVATPVLRLKTHYFALATLIIGQIVLLVATQWESVTGGANGIGGVSGLSLLGTPVGSGLPTLLVIWSCVMLAAVFAWQVARGQLGAAWAIMRANETAAQSIGIDTARLRLVAFLLSAAFAGVAGSLYVHVIRVISPEVLGFPVMVTCLTIAVVGSKRRIAGAIAGAVLIVGLPEWLRFLRDTYLLAYGGVLLLVVVALPDGLVESAERLAARLLPARTTVQPAATLTWPAMPRRGQMLLAVTGLTCRFGGVLALDGVSVSVLAGEVVGLIGPNGSGKTTLLNAVTGVFQAQGGQLRFAGDDITRRLPHEVARAGIARTFQTPVLVEEMSALDNVALARDSARSSLGQALLAGLPDHRLAAKRAEAAALLAMMGAAKVAPAPCQSLGGDMRRRVEIARALATGPRLLLLDEPAAGMDPREQADLAGRLREVAARGTAMVIVEHNMAFIAALADRLVCLDQGRLIADGDPAAVRADRLVVAAYLGQSA